MMTYTLQTLIIDFSAAVWIGIGLCVLAFVLGMIFSKKNGVVSPPQSFSPSAISGVAVTGEEPLSDEVVAVIAAAVAAIAEEDGKEYIVQRIRPVRIPSKRPLWSTAGALENTHPF